MFVFRGFNVSIVVTADCVLAVTVLLSWSYHLSFLFCVFYVNSRFLWCLVSTLPFYLHLCFSASPQLHLILRALVPSLSSRLLNSHFPGILFYLPVSCVAIGPDKCSSMAHPACQLLHLGPPSLLSLWHLFLSVQRHFKTSSGFTDSGCVCLFFYFDLDMFVRHQLIMSSV